MIAITERKISGFTPRWAEFPGFSFLFDNPGQSFQRQGNYEVLDCDFTTGFYGKLYEGFQALDPDRLFQTHLLCPLPPSSYHVTAYDLVNVGDLSRCRAPQTIECLMSKVLEMTWAQDDPLLSPALNNAFARTAWKVRFAYDRLSTGGGNALFVRLKPADDESKETLTRFREAHAELSALYRERFGVGVGVGANYGPHVSLGYFANREMVELAQRMLFDWDEALRNTVNEEPLTFESASLYAFTSMETFSRSAP